MAKKKSKRTWVWAPRKPPPPPVPDDLKTEVETKAMIQHRQSGQSSSFSRDFVVVPARSGTVFIESAEEPKFSARFDRESGVT